jgi:hypothetical protein
MSRPPPWPRAITDPDRQARTLAVAAGALAEAGQREQAAEVAARAESVARAITTPYAQVRALAAVAEAGPGRSA